LILLFLTSKIAKTHNTQAQNFGEIMLNWVTIPGIFNFGLNKSTCKISTQFILVQDFEEENADFGLTAMYLWFLYYHIELAK
jgi:hypothetical protein